MHETIFFKKVFENELKGHFQPLCIGASFCQKRKVTGSLVGKIIRHKLNTIAYETPSMTTDCLLLMSISMLELELKARVFYNVKNGSSFIMSKSSSENLSDQKKHF